MDHRSWCRRTLGRVSSMQIRRQLIIEHLLYTVFLHLSVHNNHSKEVLLSPFCRRKKLGRVMFDVPRAP